MSYLVAVVEFFEYAANSDTCEQSYTETFEHAESDVTLSYPVFPW